MSNEKSNVSRAMEIQEKAHELSTEMTGLIESDEEESIPSPPSPKPTHKLNYREKQRAIRVKEKAEKKQWNKQNRAKLGRLEREKIRKKLVSDLVSESNAVFITEMNKESKEAASFLKDDNGILLNAPTSIEDYKTIIAKRVVEIWKVYTSGWNIMQDHNCFTGGFVGILNPPTEGEWKCASCEKNNSVKMEACSTCGGRTSSTGSKLDPCPMTEIRFRTFSLPSQNWKFHVCVENMCSVDGIMAMREDSHLLEIKNNLCVYVCEVSANPHLCDDDCDTDFLNRDHEYICLLTGRSTKNMEMRGDKWQPTWNKSTCDAWKHNPLEKGKRARFFSKHDNLKALLDSEVLYQNTKILQKGYFPTVKEMIKEMPPKDNIEARKMAFSAVYLKILCVFSDDRFTNDAKQNEKKKKETSNLLDKYLARCEQQSCPANAADMHSIVTTRRLRTCYNPQININVEEKSALATYYAKKVILLWYIIVTKTPDGRTNPGRFQLDDFVTTALHLFNGGFEIPESSKGSRIQLITQDPLFAVFPITSWIEAKLHPRLKDPKKRNKSISRTKKAVQNALKGALEVGISPEELKTERISYLAMDESVFARLRKT